MKEHNSRGGIDPADEQLMEKASRLFYADRESTLIRQMVRKRINRTDFSSLSSGGKGFAWGFGSLTVLAVLILGYFSFDSASSDNKSIEKTGDKAVRQEAPVTRDQPVEQVQEKTESVAPKTETATKTQDIAMREEKQVSELSSKEMKIAANIAISGDHSPVEVMDAVRQILAGEGGFEVSVKPKDSGFLMQTKSIASDHNNESHPYEYTIRIDYLASDPRNLKIYLLKKEGIELKKATKKAVENFFFNIFGERIKERIG